MIGLVIFTVLAMAGCVFLIYFMFALWRDSRNFGRGQRVEIRKLPSQRNKGKLLRMHSAEDLQMREKKRL
jgi:threonine/homoserine/homoserine lactone efflux protein